MQEEHLHSMMLSDQRALNLSNKNLPLVFNDMWLFIFSPKIQNSFLFYAASTFNVMSLIQKYLSVQLSQT